jgi:hypothetical protein
MKRFLKTLSLLMAGLLLLVSGVDATLDHMTRSTMPSSYTWYNEKGDALFAYSGNFSLDLSKPYVKPPFPMEHMPRVIFIHRTSGTASDLKPISSRAGADWF